MARYDYDGMRRLAADIRIGIVEELCSAGFGHVGGSASIADVLAALYGGVMNIRPEDPGFPQRDYFVLSKGHSGPGLYAALAAKGYFDRSWLQTLNQGGTRLPSHCDMNRTPGVDMTTGSLGQGISCAVGIALGNRFLGRGSYTYCIVGDGETNEGQVWEAAQSAAHFALDHFVLFVDWNKKQLDGTLEEICEPCDLARKFEAFGFFAQMVKGYDVEAICGAIDAAKAQKGKPSVVVLDTIKGIGISFAEAVDFNHYMVVDEAMAAEATRCIKKRLEMGAFPGGEPR